MSSIIKMISNLKIVPVIKISDSDKAIKLAESLLISGLPLAEITFRTSSAADSIKKISTNFNEILCGAGSVIKKEQVDAAIEAGAKFIVSPGFNPKIIDYCKSKNSQNHCRTI